MPLVTFPTETRITAIGGQTQFQYTFADTGDTISPIIVSTLAVGASTLVEQTIVIDYTLDRSTKTITFLIAPGAGVIVVIARATPRIRDVKVNPASTVTGAILNKDEEQSFRVKQELEEQVSNRLGLNDRRDEYQALNRRIIDLADATGQLHAMNQQSVQTLISGSGTTPAPGAGTVGFVLTAVDATTFTWQDRGVPVPVAADVNKFLQVTAVGAGNYSYAVADSDLGNRLINGSFDISERGTLFDSTTTPANNDDTVLVDRWILLSEANNDVDIRQVTAGASPGNSKAIELTFNAQNKAGILQILEAVESLELINTPISAAFEAKIVGSTTTGVKVKMAIVAWSGSADAPTTDLVNVWGVEDTDPTYVANWADHGTPASLTVTTTEQELKLENQTLASGNNIGLFIWVDSRSTIAIGDVIQISKVRINVGAFVRPHKRRPIQTELELCQRFALVLPNESAVAQVYGAGFYASGTLARIFVPFPVTMRKIPTVTFEPATELLLQDKNGLVAVSSAVAATISRAAFRADVTRAAGATAGEAVILTGHQTNVTQIRCEAEF